MTSKPRVTNTGAASGNMVRDSALGLVPETLNPYLRLNTQIWEMGPLSAAYLEVARLRNANKVNCVFCKNARYDVAKAAGLTEDKVQMIDDDYPESMLGDREKLILAYTDQYLNDPASLSEELKTKLVATFTAQELVQLSIGIVQFNCFSRFAVALGGMPDELPRMEISLPE
ncbi:MAG: carboxymuconolactone decarboxylase family protein [Halioglobus sp.]